MTAMPSKPNTAGKVHLAVFFFVCATAFIFCMQTDVVETSNHSYIFLECLFGGRLRSFYGEVAAHQNSLYYINNAHYNIVAYLPFALAQLPVYIINHLFSLPPNEVVLAYSGKAVSALFFLGCMALVAILAQEIGLNRPAAIWAPLAFALWPPAFFGALVMGQYDAIGLFFTLLALLFWMRGHLWAFALVFGLALPAKLFSAFLFIPLLLLRQKRPLHLLKYGAAALWLLVPSSLLFAGHTFSMAHFNAEMLRRLFAAVLPAGRELPIFVCMWGLLCIFCYLWHPAQKALPRCGVWMGLCVYGLLFFWVEWHPQWLVLLAPFVVLTTLAEARNGPWLFVDIVFCAGFFLTCAAAFPGQLEANLLGFAHVTAAGEVAPLIDRYTLLQPVAYLPTALFSIGLAAHLIFKLPLRGGTPATRLLNNSASGTPWLDTHFGAGTWALFAAGFGLFWLLPVILSWVRII